MANSFYVDYGNGLGRRGEGSRRPTLAWLESLLYDGTMVWGLLMTGHNFLTRVRISHGLPVDNLEV
jgi:hypothetical protein